MQDSVTSTEQGKLQVHYSTHTVKLVPVMMSFLVQRTFTFFSCCGGRDIISLEHFSFVGWDFSK